MKREGFYPNGVGSIQASEWLIRRIRLEGFTPNADFAQRIACHPVECWFDETFNCLYIASPTVDASKYLDRAEERISKLEIEIKEVLNQHRLLNLVNKGDLELPF